MAPGDVTFDHLTPKSAGGRRLKNNLVPACRPCNQRKGARSLEAYRAECNHGAAFWGEARGLGRGAA